MKKIADFVGDFQYYEKYALKKPTHFSFFCFSGFRSALNETVHFILSEKSYSKMLIYIREIGSGAYAGKSNVNRMCPL